MKEWISVEDGLPEENKMGYDDRAFSEDVIITDGDCVTTGIYSNEEWCKFNDSAELYKMWISDKVTHWMPLPGSPTTK